MRWERGVWPKAWVISPSIKISCPQHPEWGGGEELGHSPQNMRFFWDSIPKRSREYEERLTFALAILGMNKLNCRSTQIFFLITQYSPSLAQRWCSKFSTHFSTQYNDNIFKLSGEFMDLKKRGTDRPSLLCHRQLLVDLCNLFVLCCCPALVGTQKSSWQRKSLLWS